MIRYLFRNDFVLFWHNSCRNLIVISWNNACCIRKFWVSQRKISVVNKKARKQNAADICTISTPHSFVIGMFIYRQIYKYNNQLTVAKYLKDSIFSNSVKHLRWNFFHKGIHSKCLTGFWVRLSLYPKNSPQTLPCSLKCSQEFFSAWRILGIQAFQ